MLRLRTLGPLEVTVDTGELPRELTWKKEQALLVYMAFAPNHRRTKQDVLGTLWPDAEHPKHALVERRNKLKTKGRVVIADEGDQLRLDPKTVDLDTTCFEQLERAQKWSEAAALIGGLFLEGFTVGETSGFEDWLSGEREHWRTRCGNVLTREAERLLNAASPESAEPFADRARKMLDHSDPAIRAYLKALALQWRRSEALEAGEQFVRRLADDLDTKPDKETVELIEAIRRMKDPPPQAGPKPKPRPPLIGRSAELQQVLGVWDLCRAGEPVAVLVRGTEGMGKSRFVQEVMDRARLQGATVAIARGVPGDTKRGGIGLQTLAEGGLLNAPGVAGASPAAIASLRRKSGIWEEAFPATASTEVLPFLQAVTEMIRVAALEHPVLLVADDAQWMDGVSLEGLVGLGRSLPESRVMILMTASPDPRREELDHLHSRIGGDLKGVTVTLEALTHTDLVTMARWALPEYKEVELDRIARRMLVESGGHPLIAHVIYSAIADGMRLGEITQPWPRPKNTYQDELPVDTADHLVGAVNVRFGRLTVDAQAVLRALAVLGGPRSANLLGQGAALPLPAVEKAVDELEFKQWLVADARGYSFLAQTIQSITRKGQVLAGEAQRIHERMIDT